MMRWGLWVAFCIGLGMGLAYVAAILLTRYLVQLWP